MEEVLKPPAREMVRRAERGIGLAIRNGQEAREIRKPGKRDSTGNRFKSRAPGDRSSSKHSTGRRGWESRSRNLDIPHTKKKNPVEFFPSGGGAQTGNFFLTRRS
jgi:hypothetical protein